MDLRILQAVVVVVTITAQDQVAEVAEVVVEQAAEQVHLVQVETQMVPAAQAVVWVHRVLLAVLPVFLEVLPAVVLVVAQAVEEARRRLAVFALQCQ
jgi:hypothetical protein